MTGRGVPEALGSNAMTIRWPLLDAKAEAALLDAEPSKKRESYHPQDEGNQDQIASPPPLAPHRRILPFSAEWTTPVRVAQETWRRIHTATVSAAKMPTTVTAIATT